MIGFTSWIFWRGVLSLLAIRPEAATTEGWPPSTVPALFGVAGLKESSTIGPTPGPKLDGRIGILEDDLVAPADSVPQPDLGPRRLEVRPEPASEAIRIAGAGGSLRAETVPASPPAPVTRPVSSELSRVEKSGSHQDPGDPARFITQQPLSPMPPLPTQDPSAFDRSDSLPPALKAEAVRASEQGPDAPVVSTSPQPRPQSRPVVTQVPQVYGPNPALLGWADRMVERSDLFYRVFAPTAHVVPQGGSFLAEAQNLRQAAINFRYALTSGADLNQIRGSYQNVDAWWSCLARRTQQVSQGRGGPKIQLVSEMGYVRDQIRAWLP